MRRWQRITLIVGGALIALGLISSFTLFAINGFSLAAVYNLEKRTIEKDIEENLDSITLDIAEANTNIILTSDEKSRVVIKDTNKIYHEIDSKDNSLSIKRKNSFGIFSYFVPSYSYKMEINIYLNNESLESIRVKSVSGNVAINDTRVEALAIETVSGDVSLNNIKATDLSVNTVSGSLGVNGLTTDDLFYKTISGGLSLNDAYNKSARLSSVSGHIRMDKYECDNLEVESISGNVKVIFLTNKNIEYKTISGRYIIPDSISGEGKVNIKTTSGNIFLYIGKEK